MAEPSLDVIGIGNAIVDVIARAEDSFLTDHALAKGAMTLIDAEQSEALYAAMGVGIEASGGSAANTMVGLALMGGAAGYIGKVKKDTLGEVFRHDINAASVRFDTTPAIDGTPTARCLILVTDDAQRTMNTYLGACVELGPDDIREDFIADAKVTYMEGYLWDPPGAKQAFRKAQKIAHAHGRRVSLSLSDSFCVDRYRDEFRDLVENHVDILFANEDEILSLYQLSDFDEALQLVAKHCEIAALTRSEKGSVVVGGGEIHVIDAAPVAQLTDTTGAGDLYAAGFLYGYTHDFDLARCGRLGALAASEIISHFGAKPESDVAQFVVASAGPLAGG
ncbi:MAG: adenosine kinase [Rhodospirillaceae bacterium]|nr:adenosine kinase [Rhodospirillaceae bacterium]MBT3928637.1 adenosine kinase [Rhodospirillaceae bacterium]MBT5779314.1 adenosine kinase [Rhodospirillaceae bacterium]